MISINQVKTKINHDKQKIPKSKTIAIHHYFFRMNDMLIQLLSMIISDLIHIYEQINFQYFLLQMSFQEQARTMAEFQGSKIKEVSIQDQINNPYSKIVLLEIVVKKQNNKFVSGIGTGTLINLQKKWYILTVSHNIYCQQSNNHYYKLKIHFIKNKNLKNEAQKATIIILPSQKNCFINTQFKSAASKDILHEIALIDINEEIKQIKTQISTDQMIQIQFGWKINNVFKVIYQAELLISGYSQKYNLNRPINNYRQYYVKGKQLKQIPSKYINGIKPYMLVYQLSTTPGQSGSPIMIYDKLTSKWKIVGIHVGAKKKSGDSYIYNAAVCLSNKQLLKCLIQNQKYVEQNNESNQSYSNEIAKQFIMKRSYSQSLHDLSAAKKKVHIDNSNFQYSGSKLKTIQSIEYYNLKVKQQDKKVAAKTPKQEQHEAMNKQRNFKKIKKQSMS